MVKWYNPTKGFGFVQPNDGSPDAFLHVSVLEQAGHHELSEGASIVCDIADGQRGPQVAEIHSVDSSTAEPMERAPRASDDGGGSGATEQLEGTVKFFNAEKGFGFITPDNGGKDVFISARTVERAGLPPLEPSQRVRVESRMGHKGPMAESVQII